MDKVNSRGPVNTEAILTQIPSIDAFIRDLRKVVVRVCEEYKTKATTSLCDEANAEVIGQMNSLVIDRAILDAPIKYDISVKVVYGTLLHTPRIKTELWCYEHTIACFEYRGIKVYADATAWKFSDILPEIPDYYIGIKPPWYMYLDAKNPAFHGWFGITRRVNEFIRFPVSFTDDRGGTSVGLVGAIEYLQYHVWGSISNEINKRCFMAQHQPINKKKKEG